MMCLNSKVLSPFLKAECILASLLGKGLGNQTLRHADVNPLTRAAAARKNLGSAARGGFEHRCVLNSLSFGKF